MEEEEEEEGGEEGEEESLFRGYRREREAGFVGVGRGAQTQIGTMNQVQLRGMQGTNRQGIGSYVALASCVGPATRHGH